MPAVANAVFDAVGVRVDETPITPEKVLKALKKPQASDRFGPTASRRRWPEPLPVPPPWDGGDGRASNEKPHG